MIVAGFIDWLMGRAEDAAAVQRCLHGVSPAFADAQNAVRRQMIRELIAAHLKRDVGVVFSTKRVIDDLGGDALDIAEIALKLEDTFDIDLSHAELGEDAAVTVAAFYDAVDAALVRKGRVAL